MLLFLLSPSVCLTVSPIYENAVLPCWRFVARFPLATPETALQPPSFIPFNYLYSIFFHQDTDFAELVCVACLLLGLHDGDWVIWLKLFNFLIVFLCIYFIMYENSYSVLYMSVRPERGLLPVALPFCFFPLKKGLMGNFSLHN